jgi:hypothetical protein
VEDRALRSYEGGWADKTEQEAAAAPKRVPEPPKPPPPPQKRKAPAKRKPTSELRLVEAEIAAVEARVAELEGKLADDWANMDVLTAHRAARDQLTTLLERWEALFDDAQSADSQPAT